MVSLRSLWIVVLGVVGLYGTWGRSALDGTLGHVLGAVFTKDPFLLPGTDEILAKNITGFWPLDRLLAVLIVFFWQVSDGSHPSTTAVGLYFAGQHLGVVTSMYLDSWRLGSVGNGLLSPTLWALVFQAVAIGAGGPIYAAFYLDHADGFPCATPQSYLDRAQIGLLPLSIFAGFVVPTVLMGLPSPGVVSNSFKQFAVAAWNAFPLWIFLFQTLLPRLLAPLWEPPNSTSRRSVRIVYASALLVTISTHVGISFLSVCTILFPMVFSPDYVSALHPARLFLPPTSMARVSSVGGGVRSFMLWDQLAGYATMGFLACLSLQSEARRRGSILPFWKLLGASVAGSVLIGPASTILILQWVRDELGSDLVAMDRKKKA